MNRFKKVFALLVVLIIAFTSFSGCGKGSNDPADKSTEGSTSGEETTSGEATTKVYEPVELTYKNYTSPSSGDETFFNTSVGKIIKERLNITITVAGTQQDNTEQDMMTDIASGSLADIVSGWTSIIDPSQQNILTKAAKENMLADLTKSINDYNGIIKKAMAKENLPLYTQEVIFNSDFGGKIYFIPSNYSINEPALNGWGLYIRGDIAKTLGVSTPDQGIKTNEQFYDLLKRIKDGKFKDTLKKDIYPLGNIGTWPHIMSVMNRNFDFGGATRFGMVDGKIKGFIESDYAWEQIQWMRKLIKEGLLDPESLTHSYQIGSEKLAQAHYGVTAMYHYMPAPEGGEYSKTLESSNPEMLYQPLGNLYNHMGNDKSIINKGMEAHQIIAVAKNAKTDAAIRLIEFLSTKEGKAIAHFGKEGERWFWNDQGFAQLTDEAFAASMDPSKNVKTEYGTWRLGTLCYVGGTDNPEFNAFGFDGRTVYAQNNNKFQATLKSFIEAVLPKDKTEIINKLNINVLQTKFKNADKLEPVLNLMPDTLIQCYLVKTDEEAKRIYESYMNSLKRNGYDEYIAFLQSEYDKDPNKYATYVTEDQ